VSRQRWLAGLCRGETDALDHLIGARVFSCAPVRRWLRRT